MSIPQKSIKPLLRKDLHLYVLLLEMYTFLYDNPKYGFKLKFLIIFKLLAPN